MTPLAQASQVIGFEQQVLTLGADNSAVAAKLRQLAPHFVQLFQENGVEVTGILVKVQVAAPSAARIPDGRTLNAAGRQQISGLVSTLPDSPLKDALQRLMKK